MDLTATIKAILTAHGSKPRALATASDPLNHTRTITLSDGTGADQADLSWHDQRTLAGGAAEDLDLSGTLRDAFGDVVAFARIKALLIENLSSASTLVVGGGGSAWLGPFGAAAHTLRLRPGGLLLLGGPDAMAYPVTAGSADLLRLAHGGEQPDALQYRIILLGATA